MTVYSEKQLKDMRTVCLQKISFASLMNERTEVQIHGSGDWYGVKCEFHSTKTMDAGRLRDHVISGTGEIEEGVYWCNNPTCDVRQEPFNGRLNMFQYWQLVNDFETINDSIVDLYNGRLGLELPEPDGTPLSEEEKQAIERARRQKILFLHVLYFYHKELLDPEKGKEALEYITVTRGIPEDYAKKYRLGYAPGRGQLVQYLEGVGFTKEEIVEAKMATVKDGKLNDSYWGRIMIPMFGRHYNVLSPNFDVNRADVPNFYSRMLDSLVKDNNKGLKHRYTNANFPLFNFQEARRKRAGLMIEGAFDTIASQVFIDMLTELEEDNAIPEGFDISPSELGAFASYGTNGFSEKEHMPLIQQANFDVLYIAGDHDANFAGQTANIKRGKQFKKHLPNTHIRIVTWPGKDVNQMLVSKTPPIEFLQCLQNSVSLEEYEILVALEKAGSKEILNNQFKALSQIEKFLKNLDLSVENSLLKYKKTIKTVSDYLDLEPEDVILHILMLNYKEQLKETAKQNNIPLKTLLLAEISQIQIAFSD